MQAKVKQKLLCGTHLLNESDTFTSSYNKEPVAEIKQNLLDGNSAENTITSACVNIKSMPENDIFINKYNKDLEIKTEHEVMGDDLDGMVKPEYVEIKSNDNLRISEITIKTEVDFVKHEVAFEEELDSDYKTFDFMIKTENSNYEEESLRFKEELDLQTESKCEIVYDEPSEAPVNEYKVCACKTEIKQDTNSEESVAQVTGHECVVCLSKSKQEKCREGGTTTTKSASEIIYQCEICEYRSNRKTGLKNHMLVHKPTSEISMYECSLCTYKAKLKQYLKRHMLIHKDASQVTMHECEICHYKAMRKVQLKRHRLIHEDSSNVILHQCDTCRYKTKYQESLKRHMLVHNTSSEVMMLKCGMCKYKTNRRSNLKLHMLTHKDAPKVIMYQCVLCEFKTKHAHSLKYHVTTHNKTS